MLIVGIDFTSAPSHRKPIVCCRAQLQMGMLHIESLEAWHHFEAFEEFLFGEESWFAALDFPLGQSRQLIEALDWPSDWEAYVQLVGQMTKAQFIELLDHYRATQPPGDKLQFRQTDRVTGACSPMMLQGVPVGKMFYEGAPRLQRAPVAILPCRPMPSPKQAVEGYPALVARNLVGRRPYKGGSKDDQTRKSVREEMVHLLSNNKLSNLYGFSLTLPQKMQAELVEETQGDQLDALLCTLQAAAAACRISSNYGIPDHADAAEGWITDPTVT